MKLSKLSIAVSVVTLGVASAAQAAGPTLSEVLDNSGITLNGHVAAGYTYQGAPLSTSGFNGVDKSTFAVNQAAITIAKQPKEGFGGLVNITAGRDAGYIRSYPYAASANTASGSTSTSTSGQDFDVTQAYGQYASGKLTSILGKFTTLAGAETISPVSNTNITRSIEFYTIPFTHTGTRTTYAAADNLTLIAGINNGWDQQKDANGGKTAELGLSFVPSDTVSLAVQTYMGRDAYNGGNFPGATATPSGVSNRTLVDTVLTVKATKDLTLILNADYGKQAAANGNPEYSWRAYVGYANYQWTDKLRFSLRVETFDDPSTNKLGAGVKRRNEATLTVGYAPTPSYELRAEVRNDWASKKFQSNFDDVAKTSYQTVAIEGLYKF